MGFDIPVWIADRLIDYVVPGDIGFTDPNPRFEEFTRLARAADCYVYPQVQEWLGYDYRDVKQTTAHYCAAVRNFYGAGADGFLHAELLRRLPVPDAAGAAGPGADRRA